MCSGTARRSRGSQLGSGRSFFKELDRPWLLADIDWPSAFALDFQPLAQVADAADGVLDAQAALQIGLYVFKGLCLVVVQELAQVADLLGGQLAESPPGRLLHQILEALLAVGLPQALGVALA